MPSFGDDDYPGSDPFPFGPIDDGPNCFPDNPIFEKLPQFPPPITTPLFGPTMLEALKALRDCFKLTNGRVPTQPLDDLIAHYFGDLELNTVPVVDEGEQLEANRGTEHTWVNFIVDAAPYICQCGEEFDTHEELMDHTAELNEPIPSYELGRAGAAIEAEAHRETLKQLERALDLIEGVRDEQVVSFSWYDESSEFLKEMGREVEGD